MSRLTPDPFPLPPRTFGIRHSTLVVLLTLLAGLLRFYSLDKPSVWGDEAATWRRTNGTFQQMIDELRTAGFMPGSYVATWWITNGFPVWGHFQEVAATTDPDVESRWFRRMTAQRDPSANTRLAWTPSVRLIPGGIAPTPFVLRFVPALCGTLMVPAMYFLASRLVARRTALLVALFTACSAYMLNYSRDAKMYMQLWFFAALHVACLLWWLEAYRRPRAVDEVEALPTHRRWSKRDELAEGIAGVLPAEHADDVARAFGGEDERVIVTPRVGRLETLLRFLCWLTAGFGMIAFHAVGLGVVGIELIIVLATVPQRLGWIDWLRRQILRRPTLETHGVASRFCIPPLLSFAVGATCIVLLWMSYRDFTRFYDRVEPASASSTKFDTNDAGIGWVEGYNRGRTPGSHFLRDTTAYLFNWEWVTPQAMANVKPEVLSRLRLATFILLWAILAGLVPWRSLLDRITGAPRQRGPLPATALLIVGAWLLVPAYAFYAASGAWDDAGRRVAAAPPISSIAGTIFPAAGPGEVEPLRGAVARILKPVFSGSAPFEKARAQLASLHWAELWSIRGIDAAPIRWWVIGVVLLFLAVAAIGWRRPGLIVARREVQADEVEEPPLGFRRPRARVTAALDDGELSTLRRRRHLAWLASFLLNAAAACLSLALIPLLLVIVFVVVPPQDASVWMPRYLGFVWPAFAIAACVLIRRLPLLPLRWAIVALLLATNLVNFSMRLKYGEPPTAEIARDHIYTEKLASARLFAPTLTHPQYGGPGSGGVWSMPEVYYYVTMTASPISPRGAFAYMDRSGDQLGANYASAIRGRLVREKNVDEIFVWAQMSMRTPVGSVEAILLKTLGPSWQTAEPAKRWTIFDHWTWQQLCVLERHHLKKSAEPATTQPATTRPR